MGIIMGIIPYGIMPYRPPPRPPRPRPRPPARMPGVLVRLADTLMARPCSSVPVSASAVLTASASKNSR